MFRNELKLTDIRLTRKKPEKWISRQLRKSLAIMQKCLTDRPLLLAGARSEGGELIVKYPLHLLPPVATVSLCHNVLYVAATGISIFRRPSISPASGKHRI